ncbi:MAG: hypothetical protein R3F19_18660 [Verrucomicrobiales bacterium]
MSYDYWPTGENRKVGAGTYTASYAYPTQGRLQTLTTAAGDTHWEYDIAIWRAKSTSDGTDGYAYSLAASCQRTTERGIVTLYPIQQRRAARARRLFPMTRPLRLSMVTIDWDKTPAL